MWIPNGCVVALLAALALSLPAQAARLALVVGVDNYRSLDHLKNARSDARAMAHALTGVGYGVSLYEDVGQAGFKDALRIFKAKVQSGDEVVVYFSGHGVQIGAVNYLLPADVRGDDEEQVKDDGLPLWKLLDDLKQRKPALTLAIIDACRDNPFEQKGRAIGSRGLAGTSGATGQMVIYAAGEGQRALDRLSRGDADPNGVFTRVFVKEIDKPSLPVDRVLKNVRNRVAQLARSVGHEQVPAIYDQVEGEFYFRPGDAQVASGAPVNCGTLTLSWTLVPLAPATATDFYYADLDVSAIDSIATITTQGGTYNPSTHTIHWGGDGSSVYDTVGSDGASISLQLTPKSGIDAGEGTLQPVVRSQPQPGFAVQDIPRRALQYSFSGCAGNIAPVASFTMHMRAGGPPTTKATIALGTSLHFDASASTDPDGHIVRYEWDFNSDGIFEVTTAKPVVDHTFSTAGLLHPGLRVTDDNRARSVSSFVPSVTVTSDGMPAPVCTLSASSLTAPSGAPVVLSYDIKNWTVATTATIRDSVTGGIAYIKQASGSMTVHPTGSTSYTFRAQSAGGTCNPAFVNIDIDKP